MTNPLCVHCHKPQAGHYWVNEAQFGKWLLVCPTATWQAPQELDVPVRHDTGTAEAVQGRTMERLQADSLPESLATQLAAMTAERDRARDQLAGCCACQHDGRGALTSECQEHQEQREALAALRTALAQLSARCRDVSHWEHMMSIADCADDLDRLLREKETGR